MHLLCFQLDNACDILILFDILNGSKMAWFVFGVLATAFDLRFRLGIPSVSSLSALGVISIDN